MTGASIRGTGALLGQLRRRAAYRAAARLRERQAADRASPIAPHRFPLAPFPSAEERPR